MVAHVRVPHLGPYLTAPQSALLNRKLFGDGQLKVSAKPSNLPVRSTKNTMTRMLAEQNAEPGDQVSNRINATMAYN